MSLHDTATANRAGFRQSGRRTLAELAAALAALLALAAALRGCGERATRAIVDRIPTSADATVGEAAAAAQRASHAALPASDAAAARSERVFRELVAALTPEERAALGALRETTLRDDAVNAFALPGGEVFVLTGLLDRAADDDVLRGVLAHELGHAVRRHGMRMLVRQQLVGAGFAVLLGDASAAGAMLASGAASLEGLRYGRAMEDEADAFGAALLARTGRDASGLARFLESLGSQPVPALLSTHPDPAARARALRARSR